MARPKKDGRRATGIQGKKGFLYIVLSKPVMKDGVKALEKKWISTGLADTAENIRKAQEEREKLLKKCARQPVDLNVTIADYIDHALAKKNRDVADTTYAAYLYKGEHIKKYFGATRVRDLKESMVEDFLDSLFEKDLLQPRTVKDIKVLFGNAMDLAVKDGIIAYNPVREVVISRKLIARYAVEKKAEDRFFSYEEAQRFLEGTRDNPLFEVFYITLFFGLRREEVLGLKWSAIDFNEKTMAIRHTVTKGTRVNRLNTTKTSASARKYPLNDGQVEMFRHLKEKEENNRKLCGNCYKENDYIFKHADGSLYYPDHLTKAFAKALKSMPDLPQGVTFHGLRSSCVSILVHQGMDVKSIQKWVGHADIETTLKIYAKVKDKEAKQAVSTAMDSILPLEDLQKPKEVQ